MFARILLTSRPPVGRGDVRTEAPPAREAPATVRAGNSPDKPCQRPSFLTVLLRALSTWHG